MLSKIKQSTPQPEIGEVVTVLAGNNAGQVISNTQGKYVLADRIYNQADYPDLYARIGLVGAYNFTPRTQTFGGRALTYGNGRFIVGGGGTGPTLGVSNDGITWSTGNPLSIGNIFGLVYGNGLYLYGSETGFIARSANGTSWTQATTGFTSFNGNISVMTYGNGLYIAGQSTGTTQRSTDGITWSTITPGGTLNALGYGNGLYLCSIGSTLKTSTDGITWDTRTSGTASSITAIGYGNGLYLYGGNGGALATSTDAVTWTARSSGTTAQIRSITYGNGKFVYAGTFGALASSTDGITWDALISTLAGVVSSNALITYGAGTYVYSTIGGSLGTSTNLTPEYSTTYNISTEFYVPPFSRGSRFYTLASYGSNSAPTFVNYVRAK